MEFLIECSENSKSSKYFLYSTQLIYFTRIIILKDIAIYYRMKLYISPSKTLKDNWD
jgi:hypothetical protein